MFFFTRVRPYPPARTHPDPARQSWSIFVSFLLCRTNSLPFAPLPTPTRTPLLRQISAAVPEAFLTVAAELLHRRAEDPGPAAIELGHKLTHALLRRQLSATDPRRGHRHSGLRST